MAEQFVEVAAALLILAAFTLNQFRGLDRHAPLYLLLNLAGSVVLAVIAGRDRQWGFFLLQASWGLMSLWGLIAPRWRTRPL